MPDARPIAAPPDARPTAAPRDARPAAAPPDARPAAAPPDARLAAATTGPVSVAEIRLLRADRALEVAFSDGTRARLPAEYLRVESPSAEVQGHAPGEKRLVAGRRHVNIIAVEPVGNYAVRLTFDDLHDTGIYTWSTLHDLARNHAARWSAYEAALAGRGLSRDPPPR